MGLVLNIEFTIMFRSSNYERSIPDVTFASKSLVSLENWRVLEDFSMCNRQYIVFEVINDISAKILKLRKEYYKPRC